MVGPAEQRFSRDELEAAFRKVANPRDWKSAIDTVIPVEDQDVVAEAVAYFTATEVTWGTLDASGQPIPENQIRVRALGYRQGPAGP